MSITLAKTAVCLGATVLNYAPVEEFIKKEGKCIGVKARDLESGNSFVAHGKVIINATEVFSDSLLQMDDSKASPIIAPSRGVHIVVEDRVFSGNKALLIPKTKD